MKEDDAPEELPRFGQTNISDVQKNQDIHDGINDSVNKLFSKDDVDRPSTIPMNDDSFTNLQSAQDQQRPSHDDPFNNANQEDAKEKIDSMISGKNPTGKMPSMIANEENNSFFQN